MRAAGDGLEVEWGSSKASALACLARRLENTRIMGEHCHTCHGVQLGYSSWKGALPFGFRSQVGGPMDFTLDELENEVWSSSTS